MEISDINFDKEVVEKSRNIPVLVDFWANWCAPCRTLGPILEEVEKDLKGKFILAKVNVEENQNKPREYGVMSIPNVKLFKDGKISDEFVGAIPKIQVEHFLKKNGIK